MLHQNVRTQYTSATDTYIYSIGFTYSDPSEVNVRVFAADGSFTIIYDWEFLGSDQIRFTSTPPPEFEIYRETNIALSYGTAKYNKFNSGSIINSSDLNGNFELLRSAIEENAAIIEEIQVDGGISTNLSYDAPSRLLMSSTGDDVTLPLVDSTNAGLMASTDKTKLDGLSTDSVNDGKYVAVAGDNMTGDLTLGTDKITFDATAGGGTFAGDVVSGEEPGGGVNAGCKFGKSGFITATRDGVNQSILSAYTLGNSNKTIEFLAGGSATFAGDMEITIPEGSSSNKGLTVSNLDTTTRSLIRVQNDLGTDCRIDLQIGSSESDTFSVYKNKDGTYIPGANLCELTSRGADTANLVIGTNTSVPLKLVQNAEVKVEIGDQVDISGDTVFSDKVMIGTTIEGAANEADNLTISDSDSVGVTIRSTNSTDGRIYFSDGTSGTSEYAGYQIYNHSSNAMIFGTNAIERMRIDSSGDVEIGSGKYLTWVASPGGTHRGRIKCDSGDSIVFENTSGNDERMRIDSSGRLLVGTSSDLSGNDVDVKLQVLSNGGATIHLARDDSSTVADNLLGAIVASTTDGGASQRACQINFRADGDQASKDHPGRIEFLTTVDGASSPTEHMRIDSSGNVGIGSTNPGKTLEVRSAANSLGGIRLNELSDTYHDILSSGGHLYIHADSKGNNKLDNVLRFGVGSTGERMRIDKSGNVGIGTADPKALLDVNGSATFAGEVQSGGDPNNGVNVGCKLYGSQGTVAATASGSIDVWVGHSQGTTAPTSTISADGSASFAGKVTCGNDTFTGAGTNISASGNVYIQGTTADVTNSNIALSVVNPTVFAEPKVTIRHDGSASFSGRTTSFGISAKTTSESNPLMVSRDTINVNSKLATFKSSVANGTVGNLANVIDFGADGSASFAIGSFVIDGSGTIQTNINSAGNIKLDSTGDFSDPNIWLKANDGSATFKGTVTENATRSGSVEILLEADDESQYETTTEEYEDTINVPVIGGVTTADLVDGESERFEEKTITRTREVKTYVGPILDVKKTLVKYETTLTQLKVAVAESSNFEELKNTMTLALSNI